MSVTIKDVAKCAGVGVGTVSRVLNGGESVNEEKCLRVQEAIKKLNFVPNRMAVRLRKNASGLLALLVPVINHPFFAKFAYFAEDEASKYGYSLLLVSSQHRISKEEEILGRIKRREVDGAIFVTHYEHKEESLKDCPIVSIDRQLGKEIPYVTSDNYEATKKAVEFLIEKGCKKIELCPKLGDLEWAEGTYPLPQGILSVSHRRNADGTVITEYTAPEGVKVEIVE